MGRILPKGINVETNGPPPETAAWLYEGVVMHQRMKPKAHRFSYPVFSLCIDVDQLEEADHQSGLFSVGRFNLFSFQPTDHTRSADISLRQHIEAQLREHGIDQPMGRILLVCYPRILGFVFNPLSVYYCYDDDGALALLVYEVRNTFGERHSYICPVRDGELSNAGLKQSCDKIFHVSPFIPLNMRYHFRMLPPGADIRWRILETDPTGPLLAASFAGTQRPLDSRTILALAFKMPFLTLKIVAAIHWEAAKLIFKGLKYIPKPKPPTSSSTNNEAPLGEWLKQS